MFYKIAMSVVGIIWRLWFNLKIIGKENEPEQGGYIFACNHSSSIDPMIVCQGIRKHHIRFMAKEELFDIPVLGLIIKWLGVFPVSRGIGDMSAIETAIETIQKGLILGLFPEGTRSKDGQLQRFKSGLAFIAFKTHAGVLPAVTNYHNGKKFRSLVTVTYGKFIPYEDLGFSSGDGRELKEATRMIHDVMLEIKTNG